MTSTQDTVYEYGINKEMKKKQVSSVLHKNKLGVLCNTILHELTSMLVKLVETRVAVNLVLS